MAPNGTTLSPEMTDHWPDCRWKIADSTDAGYPNEPWAHSQNVQQSFFSARFSKRRVFLEHLTPERKERIEHELDRIGKVRRRFVIDDNKKALMETLRSTLDDWRKCVATGKEAMMEQIDKEALLKGYYKSNRHERECEILRRCNVSAPGTEDQAMVIHGRSKRRQSKAKIGKARGTKAEAQQAPKTLPIAESVEEEKVDEPEPLYGLKACAISYGGYTFPNQKIAMHKILESTENNPLMERCPMDCIRYFHFPTNNMEWIERAIARYYNEEPKPLDDKHHAYRPDGRKTEKLLSREFWRGQMHGSSAYGSNSRTELGNASYPAEDWARKGGPIHARHMRSKCAIIPRDTMSQSGLRQGSSAPTLREGSTSSGSNSNPERPFTRGKNIALFLPYMHWETSSRRAKMVEVINETIDHKKKDPKLLDIAKKIRGKSTSKVKTEPKPWKRLLATYLFTLAQVAEQMDYEADERLLRDFVKADPPLHIRRTLDQYYFVTLDDTSQRDKDQVVYRALIIVDQCSRVFFDRTKPLDQRPEVMDIFASAIAHVDQMTAVAYDTFWRNTNLYNKDPLRKVVGTKYLDINPEGALLKEAQDIAEELKMMKRIYNEQLKVVKDFKRHLIHPQGRQVGKGDSASQLQKLLLDLIEPKDKQEDGDEEENDDPDTTRPRRSQSRSQVADETLHEAEGVLELVKSRRTEIIELEQSVLHTCRQLEGFLTLKQQQASIVEAKAALERAEESVKQGRAIMAFTIVTIFFASAPFPYSPTPNFYTDLLTCYALDSYRWVSSQPSSE
ncbi:CorA-like Mg2+ transporter protein [Apiospora marii]|uniref:CorA-like Mg2+ transporter protein n=1 Tax=Apiospora marii TaxID=335849 RepID=A0ABR1SSF9_9PEZI